MKKFLSGKLGVLLGAGMTVTLMTGITKADTLSGFGQAGRIYTRYIFSRTVFTGECPGRTGTGDFDNRHLLINQSLVKNGEIPQPQKQRRVRIINQSNGAYTDREWEPQHQQQALSNYRSEDFDIELGSGHSGRHFNLLEGENNLIAIFYDGKDYEPNSSGNLARYELKITATIEEETEVRNRKLSDVTLECAANLSLQGNAITDENCPGARQQVQYLQCPDGSGGNIGRERIIQATIPGPGNRPSDQKKREFRIVNNTSETLAEIYLSPSSSSSWGANNLTNWFTPYSASNFPLNSPSCMYDLRAIFSSGRVIEEHQINTCKYSGYTLR